MYSMQLKSHPSVNTLMPIPYSIRLGPSADAQVERVGLAERPKLTDGLENT